MVRPGALAALVQYLRENPSTRFAHCSFDLIDELGRPLEQKGRGLGDHHLADGQTDYDHRRELLRRGGVAANHLRTYRREVFAELGGFNEQLRCGEDYEMALRIAERYPILLVAKQLYSYRIRSDSTTGTWRFKGLRFLVNRWRIARALAKNGDITFTKSRQYDLNRQLVLGVLQSTFGRPAMRATG